MRNTSSTVSQANPSIIVKPVGLQSSELIRIECKCGEQMKIDTTSQWEVEMIGQWKFTHHCGWTVTVPNDELIQDIKDHPEWAKPEPSLIKGSANNSPNLTEWKDAPLS